MGPNWVLSAPDGPHVGPMNLAIWVYFIIPWEIQVENVYWLYTSIYTMVPEANKCGSAEATVLVVINIDWTWHFDINLLAIS